MHDVDLQPQIALIVADHGPTTVQQRARMVNVGVCSGSQSQRRGNMLINIETVSFDQRTSVVAAGGRRLTNSFIGASSDRPPIYDVVRAVLHSHCMAIWRMNVITLSSDCATNCTSAASDRCDEGGRRPAASRCLAVRVTRPAVPTRLPSARSSFCTAPARNVTTS